MTKKHLSRIRGRWYIPWVLGGKCAELRTAGINNKVWNVTMDVLFVSAVFAHELNALSELDEFFGVA